MAGHKKFKKSFSYDGIRYYVEADTAEGLAAKMAVKQYELEHPPEKQVTRATTVAKWLDEYIESYRRDYITHRQYINLRSNARAIKEVMGRTPLKDVKRRDCERVVGSMAGLSRGYIRKVMGLLRSAFDAAVEDDLMAKNPVPKKIRMPQSSKPAGRRRTATDAERAVLLACGERMGDPYDAYIKLMLYFGLRPSEAARVQGCHFDLKTRALHVAGTKTEAATRDVPIPAHLMDWAGSYKSAPFSLLMRNQRGEPVDAAARYRLWNAIRREIHIHQELRVYRNGIKPPYALAADLTAYCLRHTYASDMVAKGVPKEVVSLIMGHADIDVTDIYIKLTPEMFAGALAKIDPERSVGAVWGAPHHDPL